MVAVSNGFAEFIRVDASPARRLQHAPVEASGGMHVWLTRLQAREAPAPAPPASIGSVHHSRRADAVATLNLGDSQIVVPTSCAGHPHPGLTYLITRVALT